MSSTRELAKLFESVAAKNFHTAEAAASSIIETERKKGHTSAARSLKAALSGSSIRGARHPEPLTAIIQSSSFLSSALDLQKELTPLNSVMLRPELRSTVEAVIKEYLNRDRLQSRGIRRRSKLILVGPPGCGKSLTAGAIAFELNLPFYVVRFDAIIAAYLGQTAARLRELFDFAAQTPCVLLFDEIDALGKQRGSTQDVGELDRIVIAMMQELEFFKSPGILIATSNLPTAIDAALWRRFDEALTYKAPTNREMSIFIDRLIERFGIKLSSRSKTSLLGLKSFAEVEKAIERLARNAVLAEL